MRGTAVLPKELRPRAVQGSNLLLDNVPKRTEGWVEQEYEAWPVAQVVGHVPELGDFHSCRG